MSPGVRAHLHTDLSMISDHRLLITCVCVCVCACQAGYVEAFTAKEDEENSMHNTVVMFSTSDHFTLRQVCSPVCDITRVSSDHVTCSS